MNAQQVVDKIGSGVQAALKTNQLFLGVEQFEFENADIHPEYVTTVKVAEKLTGPEFVVSLETHMKTLRRQAIGIARIQNMKDKDRRDEIVGRLSRYKFGKKDSQRLDVLVLSADSLSPPHLMAEAKLGVHNLPGLLNDIDRIVKLLSMYEEAGAFNGHAVYGAVVFHLMREKVDVNGLKPHAQSFLAGISAHLSNLSSKYAWLNHKADLLTSWHVSEGVSGYQEYHDDGTVEDVFGKEGFAFTPGLVLLGNGADIPNVTF